VHRPFRVHWRGLTPCVTRRVAGLTAHVGEIRKLQSLLEVSQAVANTIDLEAGLERVLELLERRDIGALTIELPRKKEVDQRFLRVVASMIALKVRSHDLVAVLVPEPESESASSPRPVRVRA